MKKIIPLSVPNLKGNELKYVTEAIEDEWISTGGSYINEFEENIAEYLNVNMAVACQSGTAAIHLSLLESKIEENNEVIVPTLTFIAAVNPVTYCKAHPVFMDCDESLTIDTNKLEEFCEQECNLVSGNLVNKKSNRIVKAIIVVHVFGNMANMIRIMEIAKRFNLIVIEDATEALGTYYKEGVYKNCFAGTIGDFGCYSFNGNKILTTGGGGVIVANNKSNLEHIKYLSTQAKDDALQYKHDEIGYNYRMTNVQAAIGVAQLETLEKFIDIKENNYKVYKREFRECGIEMLSFSDKVRPNYWFYSLLLCNKEKKNIEVIEELIKSNIQTRPIWGLIHQQKPYLSCEAYKVEKALYYHESIINIPCSTNLEENDIIYVANQIKKILK